MANLDIPENRLPQDGRISINFRAREVGLRVSTFPTTQGENVVFRLLERADAGAIRRAARAQGMRTMVEDGIRKAIRGFTTLEEVAREAVD